jgi:hypothetical protein
MMLFIVPRGNTSAFMRAAPIESISKPDSSLFEYRSSFGHSYKNGPACVQFELVHTSLCFEPIRQRPNSKYDVAKRDVK